LSSKIHQFNVMKYRTKKIKQQELLYQQLGTVPNYDIINLKDPANADIKANAPLYYSAFPVSTKEMNAQEHTKQLEETYLDFRQDYLEFNEMFSREDLIFKSSIDPFKVFFRFEPSKSTNSLEPILDYVTGQVTDVREVTMNEEEISPQTSTSRLRDPGNFQDFVRGSTKYVPFLPGGIHKEDNNEKENRKKENLPEDPIDPKPEEMLKILPGVNMSVVFDDNGKMQLLCEDKTNVNISSVSLATNSANLLAQYADLQIDYNSVAKQRHDEQKRRMEEISEKQKNVELMMETLGLFDDNKSQKENQTLEKSLTSSETTTEDETSMFENLRPKFQSEATQSSGIEIVMNTKKRSFEWAVTTRIPDISSRFKELIPELALEFPFELDDFQKEAIYHLEKGETVFVAAHTSAGKTVVAEYAVALAIKHMTRVIYTSPIKALSNQKFRDFKDIFEDVGLITGDVSIKPDATCLIVTTEILRSMLYKGADLIRDVEWVIFDEVHYINDIERGVVWEEVIIMLPEHINMIFLSATVPNTAEFAEWVGLVKRKKVFVIKTEKRPVPLEHYLYVNKELYKIVDKEGNFLSMGYQAASAAFKEKEKAKQAKTSGKVPQRGGSKFDTKLKSEKSEWIKIITVLKQKNLLPVVCFAFSKRKCEELAFGLGNTDLNEKNEKAHVYQFIEASLQRLKGTDRELPQVIRIRDLLMLGIGIHHSGLLPIIKEMVEILFSRGLVKVLFATETFAMGVNMPARTVVFHSLRKHDGRDFRDLLPGEYVQMSGRAGRRGIDSVGTVIIVCSDGVPESMSLIKIVTGKTMKLESRFKLTYSMILNLFKFEGEFGVPDMMRRSFAELLNQRLANEYRESLRVAKEKLANLKSIECIRGDPDIENYYQLTLQERDVGNKMTKWILKSTLSTKYLRVGRVLIINSKTRNLTNAIAVFLKMTTLSMASERELEYFSTTDTTQSLNKIVTVLALTRKPTQRWQDMYRIEELPLSEVTTICDELIKIDANQILIRKNPDAIKTAIEQLEDVMNKYVPDLPPALDPIKDLKIKDFDFMEMYVKHKEILQAMQKSKCQDCPLRAQQFEYAEKKWKLMEQIKDLTHLLSEESLSLMPEFRQRVSVLQRLKYIDNNNVVQLKGRCAREMNTVDALVGTELIFESVLAPLTPEEIASVLSSLVFQENSDVTPILTERLEAAKTHVINIAISLANLQIECGMNLTPQEYVAEAVHTGLMEVVYNWAKQMSFASICTLTDVAEGTIVRTIVRLDETLRDFKNAARIIGDISLAKKLEEASQLIKRDIVFAASLYY